MEHLPHARHQHIKYQILLLYSFHPPNILEIKY